MKKTTQIIGDYEIYELDRGTANANEKSRRIQALKSINTPYKSYRKRVGLELENLSIEIKRMIDQKIMPLLSTHISNITDKRFNSAYCDVKVYPRPPQDSDFISSNEILDNDNLYIFINFVVSIPKNDSLDSLTRAAILSYFQEEDDWTSFDKNASKLKKSYGCITF